MPAAAELTTIDGVLAPVPAWPPPGPVPRDAPDAASLVAARVQELAAVWPAAPDAPRAEVWRLLAAAGREDLAVARLLEGHVDAHRILAEAGRAPRRGAVYGVWASASGGTGVTIDGDRLQGGMRYCSGAAFLDRALVLARPPGEPPVLLDVDARHPALTRDEASWPAVGMDVTRSVDVRVDGLTVAPGDAVGPPGFYLERPGFPAGGVGVAAVWLGGAAGVLDALLGTEGPHRRAHTGAMATALVAADAVLGALAARPDAQPVGHLDALAARTAVDAAVDEVLRRAPRVSGPTPLCRDAAFAHRTADLQVYVRQHHAEADQERIGDALAGGGTVLGRRFGPAA